MDSAPAIESFVMKEARLRKELEALQEEHRKILESLQEPKREDNLNVRERLDYALEEIRWMQHYHGAQAHIVCRQWLFNPKTASAAIGAKPKGFQSLRQHKIRQEKILQKRY